MNDIAEHESAALIDNEFQSPRETSTPSASPTMERKMEVGGDHNKNGVGGIKNGHHVGPAHLGRPLSRDPGGTELIYHDLNYSIPVRGEKKCILKSVRYEKVLPL